jgi:hypothetical protein
MHKWSFFRQVNCDCIDYSMHNYESGMFSGTEFGGIVLGPRPRTFGMALAMFSKQYSDCV